MYVPEWNFTLARSFSPKININADRITLNTYVSGRQTWKAHIRMGAAAPIRRPSKCSLGLGNGGLVPPGHKMTTIPRR